MISGRASFRAFKAKFNHDSFWLLLIKKLPDKKKAHFGHFEFTAPRIVCLCFWLGWGRRVGQRAGGACPTKAALRGRRGSEVKGGRRPSRSDAEGALDFGGAAPYAAPPPPRFHEHTWDEPRPAGTAIPSRLRRSHVLGSPPSPLTPQTPQAVAENDIRVPRPKTVAVCPHRVWVDKVCSSSRSGGPGMRGIECLGDGRAVLIDVVPGDEAAFDREVQGEPGPVSTSR